MLVRVKADESSVDGIADGWTTHPFTQHLARQATEDTRAAIDRLVSGAKTSTDPKVVALVGEYLASRQMAELFAGKWEKG